MIEEEKIEDANLEEACYQVDDSLDVEAEELERHKRFLEEYNVPEKARKLYFDVHGGMVKSTLVKNKMSRITLGTAVAMAVTEREKDKKESKFVNSKFGRGLISIGLRDPYRRHLYEAYDLIATYMSIVERDSLSIDDVFSLTDNEDIYQNFFRAKYEELAKTEFDILCYYGAPKSEQDPEVIDALHKRESELKGKATCISFYEIDEIKKNLESINSCSEM